MGAGSGFGRVSDSGLRTADALAPLAVEKRQQVVLHHSGAAVLKHPAAARPLAEAHAGRHAAGAHAASAHLAGIGRAHASGRAAAERARACVRCARPAISVAQASERRRPVKGDRICSWREGAALQRQRGTSQEGWRRRWRRAMAAGALVEATSSARALSANRDTAAVRSTTCQCLRCKSWSGGGGGRGIACH